MTVTKVDITRDLRHAKVYVSVIGEQEAQKVAVDTLQNAAGFIAVRASKQVIMRFFPELRFILDDSAEKQMQIDILLNKIEQERKERGDHS